MSSEQTTTADTSQIKIHLFTREEDPSLQPTDSAASNLYVPISLQRYGLSEIVNHLLELEQKVPFDFLINGVLLRTSLQQYINTNGLSSEVTLQIEYTRAVLPPSFLSSLNDEDWIGSIDVYSSNSNNYIAAGSYDGVIRTYNNAEKKIQKLYSGHSGPIRSIKCISETRLVSGSNDRTLRLWKTRLNPNQSNNDDDDEDVEDGKTLAILEGHKAPVVSIDVSIESSKILSASYDNSIGFWSTNYKEMNVVDPLEDINNPNNKMSTAAKKRRKLSLKDSSIRRRAPLAILESHTSPVEQVIFDGNDNTVAYSVSQDHTIKTWDLVSSRCIDTKATSYSLLSIAQLKSLNLLACGSSARHITLHDPRMNSSSKITQHQLIGHKNFVVSLDTCPENEFLLASGSHDGTVKVWDVRSTNPMYTITRNSLETDPSVQKGVNDKVFAVRWAKGVGIVSGGQDKKIQINKGDDIFKK